MHNFPFFFSLLPIFIIAISRSQIGHEAKDDQKCMIAMFNETAVDVTLYRSNVSLLESHSFEGARFVTNEYYSSSSSYSFSFTRADVWRRMLPSNDFFCKHRLAAIRTIILTLA